MPHRLKAIITRQKINEEEANKLGFKYFEEPPVWIIPLSAWHLQQLADQQGVDQSFNPIADYNCEFTHQLIQRLGISDYLYVRTDYHAGMGSQSAKAYQDGVRKELFFSINEALKKLMGVIKSETEIDEFDTIGLYKYRSGERFYDIS